jgi:hypothetical protein
MSQWLHGPGITLIEIQHPATTAPTGGDGSRLQAGDAIVTHIGENMKFGWLVGCLVVCLCACFVGACSSYFLMLPFSAVSLSSARFHVHVCVFLMEMTRPSSKCGSRDETIT